MTDLTLRRALARQLRFTQHLTDAGAWSGAAEGLLPVIAAHEAEVVGSVLDRIDALHQSEDVPTSQHYYCEPYECDRAGEGGMEPICTECRVDFPCPTRRLTAEIRGEMRLSQGAAAIRGEQ